jgi:hypothetical protein
MGFGPRAAKNSYRGLEIIKHHGGCQKFFVQAVEGGYVLGAGVFGAGVFGVGILARVRR